MIEDVIVSDKNGANIEGLSAGDFAVAEDGVPQTISVFEFQKAAGISSYYVIGYYSSHVNGGGQFRKAAITLKSDPSAKLEYRPGYYGETNPVRSAGTGPAGVDNRIDPGLTTPVVIYRKDPEYSEAARKAKYSGSVVLSVTVAASGQAADVKVIRALGLGLDEKAIEAVKQWRFRPGTKEGMPVSVQTQVEVSFRLL
ncbi:MAG TPA: TonB family protein [Bryobacteraceae bacterium]|nr:TonB family protein [Bryobacteraceae bacterium]